MLLPSLDPADLKPGQTLPRWEHAFSAVDLMAYGAATWDWHRVHYDLDYARARKLPGLLIDGQVYGAIFARLATRWAGPDAFLSAMKLRMKSMAFAGDTLHATGEVSKVEREGDGYRVYIEQFLWCGERAVAQGSTTLLFSRKGARG